MYTPQQRCAAMASASRLLSAVLLVGLLGCGSATKPSAIFTVLIDDLGYSDTQ